MTRKIILCLSIICLVIINIVLDMNINNYINLLNNCFSINIVLTDFYYTFICSIITFISIIYRKTNTLFRKENYVVKVFNLKDMIHSDRWNPLGENKDITDIQTSSNVIIMGIQKQRGKDNFWPRAEENFLKAFEFYFLENKLDQNTLTDIYKIISNGNNSIY